MTSQDPSRLALETRIRARPEAVFAFFTRADAYRRWMGERAELDARPGGLYRVHVRDDLVAEGRFVHVEPPVRVVFTWGWVGHPAIPAGSTTVEVTLRWDGDATLLRLEHTGLPSETARDEHRGGWRRYLDRLAVAGAGGDPGPDHDA